MTSGPKRTDIKKPSYPMFSPRRSEDEYFLQLLSDFTPMKEPKRRTNQINNVHIYASKNQFINIGLQEKVDSFAREHVLKLSAIKQDIRTLQNKLDLQIARTKHLPAHVVYINGKPYSKLDKIVLQKRCTDVYWKSEKMLQRLKNAENAIGGLQKKITRSRSAPIVTTREQTPPKQVKPRWPNS